MLDLIPPHNAAGMTIPQGITVAPSRIAIYPAAWMPTDRSCVEVFRFVSWAVGYCGINGAHESLRRQVYTGGRTESRLAEARAEAVRYPVGTMLAVVPARWAFQQSEPEESGGCRAA